MNQQQKDNSSGILRQLGPLRVALSTVVLLLVAIAPFSGMDTNYDNLSVIPTIVAPVLVPIVFFVLWLDVLMSKVFGSQATTEFDKKRHRLAVRVNIIAVVLLVAAWTRFYYQLIG